MDYSIPPLKKKKKKRKGASKRQLISILSSQGTIKCKNFKKCGITFSGKPGGIEPEIHHKDSNKENNKKSNLIALCPNCHQVFDKKNKEKKEKGNGKKSKQDDSKLPYDISLPKWN